MDLRSKVALRFVIAIPAFGAMLFIPAGSLKFWQGWVFIVIWLGLNLGAFLYLYKYDRELLERRLRRKENVRAQKIIMTIFFVVVVGYYMLPGFDHRFGWSHSPVWLTIGGEALVVAGYSMIFWVMKVNRFAASTIRVEAGQTLIADGPYRIVRHPMYLGAGVMLLFTPLALGSYYGMLAFVLIFPLLVLRLLNEEKVLLTDLSGYREYCLQTRFRLLPGIW